MAAKNTRHPALMLIPLGVSLIAIAVFFMIQPPGSSWPIRATAILGYTAIVSAVISTAFVRQLVKAFGRPFIKVHHAYSIGGLVWIALHPLAVVASRGSAKFLLPRFDSLSSFLMWGGAPALYLLAIAAGAAVLRKRVGNLWRPIHALNYVALALGTLHAMRLGSDFISIIMRAIAILVIVALIATGVWRRVLAARRAKKRRQRTTNR